MGRSPWPRRFLGGVAWICGVTARCHGEPARAGDLLVSNHVSWMDIPVLARATGCAFVSKAEVRDHWFMQWIADQNATVYIDRGHRRGIAEQLDAVRRALSSPQPLALFPEGTVGDGERLLPFKPSLLSAVAPTPAGVRVRAVAVDYGAHFSVVRWQRGEPGLGNFLRVLGSSGRIEVTVHLLGELPGADDRKALARAAHNRIAAALAPSGIAAAGI
jgi:1-acyl-sn-glycerol-3-phosphate acyltransferase